MSKNYFKLYISSFVIIASFILVKNYSPANQAQVLGQAIFGNQPTVALTFDDGPGPQTHEVLDILREYSIPATFFVVGKWVNEYPEILERINNEGHELGNHTNTHKRLVYMDNKQLTEEITIGNEKIYDITNHRTKLFRPPYGWYDDEIIETVDLLGMKIMTWNIDPTDWLLMDYDKITREVIGQLKPQSVILLHDGPGNTDRSPTIQSLPYIIDALKSYNYKFVTASEIEITDDDSQLY